MASFRAAAAAAAQAGRNSQPPRLNAALPALLQIKNPAAGVRHTSILGKLTGDQQPLTNRAFKEWAQSNREFQESANVALAKAATERSSSLGLKVGAFASISLTVVAMYGGYYLHENFNPDPIPKSKILTLASDKDFHKFPEYSGSILLSTAWSQVDLNPLPYIKRSLEKYWLSSDFPPCEKNDDFSELSMWKIAAEASSWAMICMVELKLSCKPLTVEDLWWRLSIIGFAQKEFKSNFDLLAKIGVFKMDSSEDPPTILFNEDDFVACRKGVLKGNIHKALKEQLEKKRQLNLAAMCKNNDEGAQSEMRKSIMQARIQKKLTRAQLAQMISLKPEDIEAYETGKQSPNAQSMEKLELVLGTKLPRNK